MVYGDLIIVYPQLHSIYLRETIGLGSRACVRVLGGLFLRSGFGASGRREIIFLVT